MDSSWIETYGYFTLGGLGTAGTLFSAYMYQADRKEKKYKDRINSAYKEGYSRAETNQLKSRLDDLEKKYWNADIANIQRSSITEFERNFKFIVPGNHPEKKE